ncbi:MAG: sigma-70 family RNA polymerase sigma factor [Actinobacteria bacterium]|nr:MAG: sigma-70 family RNA polymerase sigma factor [Actinomycetota bacterium]
MLGASKTAFEIAVADYLDDLYRYAYWLCRDRWLAEDLAQETVLRAWRGWSRLREARAVKGWLFTILYREFVRSAARKRMESEPAEALRSEPYDHADPALAIDLDRALRGLGEDSRHAILLQVLGGFSCAEIAAVLGSSEGAVMTRLTRARQALRRSLEPGETDREANEA